jgi:outer membrane lipoprotein-sorting protein
MCKHLTITILTILAISAFAQTPQNRRQRNAQGQHNVQGQGVTRTERGIEDPRAHEILNAVRRHLKSFNSIKIEFTYVHENRITNTRDNSMKGTLLLRGNRYNLTFMGQNSRSDGKTVWNYNRDTREIYIENADPKSMETMNPIALIETYEQNFRAKLIREDVENGVAVMHIDLIPFEARSFHKIRMITDKARNTIVATEIHEKGGSIFTFRVDRMQTNVSAPNSEFTFDLSKLPGVEVIDLR